MSDYDSIFGDCCDPIDEYIITSEEPQTRIHPSTPSTSRSSVPDIKSEVLIPSIESDVETKRVGGTCNVREPGDGLYRSFDINFKAFEKKNLSWPLTTEFQDSMAIDKDRRSIEARETWTQDAGIKLELDLPVAAVADPIAAQRVMMERFRKKQQNEGKRTDHDTLVPSRLPLGSRRTVSHDLVVIEDKDRENHQMDVAYDEDDDRWMDNGESSGEDGEMINLKSMRDSFEEQQRLNSLSKAEVFQLAKLNEKIEVRKRREEIAKETIFITDDEDFKNHDEENYDRESMDIEYTENLQTALAIEHGLIEGEAESKKKVAAKHQKRRGPVPKTARDVEENRRVMEREKESKKRARVAISKSKSLLKAKAKKARLVKAQEKGRYKSRMKNGFAGAKGVSDETLQTLLQDLIHNNFIADRQNQEDFGDAPDINERSKMGQLEALQASAPENYDSHKLKTDRSDLTKASRRFGYKKVTSCNGKWLLKGMISSLYHHQLLAADWMVSRELGTTGPFGGLLADAMGVGKTVETLAAMVGNPPSKDHIRNNIKTTLLVLPSSAIKQWQDEIRTHVKEEMFPSIVHYTAKKEIPIIAIQNFDIVLTSYAEVMKSFPYPSAKDLEAFGNTGGYSKWITKCKKTTGDLHKIEWYRIVLDEAQSIKNFKTRTSLACQNLQGKYRWALSGTPIQNRVDELFPYFRFLRAPWTNNYSEFREYFCDPDASEANARINVILSIVMLRRTMKDKILGRPIVELPQIYPETQFISFSKEEWVIYKVLEKNFRDNLNRHFESGTAERNYSMFMVQLLRLRQCTSHPFLLEKTIKEALGPSDLMELNTELKKLSLHKQPIYKQIAQWIQETEAERAAARARGEPVREPGEETRFGKSEFGRFFRMGKFLESVAPKDVATRMVCMICGDHPTDPFLLDCHHCYCCECLRNYMASEVERNDGKAAEFYECPVADCKKFFVEGQKLEDALNDMDEENPFEPSGYFRKVQERFRRGGAFLDDDSTAEPSDWLSMCKDDPQNYILPSAKMIALKARILKWINEAPNDKILIFTQFRLLIKIIGLICDGEGWGSIAFTGNMTQDHRYDAINRFHKDPAIKIMIAGLKCGGQALNLTCANRVISIDLWWNHSVEQQAFGRVFRIGQKKETHVSRFVVKGTVDQRLLAMQADKVKTIDQAMQDTGPCMAPLSIEELATLFGHLSRNENGTLHVEDDYDEDDEMEDPAERSDDDKGDA